MCERRTTLFFLKFTFITKSLAPKAEGEKEKAMAKNFNVEIKEATGTCSEELFGVMASNGDLTSSSVKEHVGEVITIAGTASAHITTKDKDFDNFYMDTDKGLIHTGSQIFIDSVVNYLKYTNVFRVNTIKTKQGTAFKAVPVLGNKTDNAVSKEELPLSNSK